MDTRLDIERGFTFFFKDPKWLEKAAIGGFLTLTLIGGPAVFGWVLEIQRRVMGGTQDDTLPDWDQLGDYFIEGLKMWLVSMVWFLPFLLVQMLFMFPLFLFPFVPLIEDAPGFFIFLFTFLPFLFMPVAVILGFVTYTIYPVITGLYLENRRIEDAFNFRQVYTLVRANFWLLLAASFLGYIASYAASMAGMLLCFVGIFFASPIATAILYHFFGQAYRISKIKLAAHEAQEEVEEERQDEKEEDQPED